MQGYFDIHCHILPGIDDGPKTLEETLRMLYIAYEEGIRVIVATPHYASDGQSDSQAKIQAMYNEINAEIEQAGLEISIILGNELLYCTGIIEALDRGDALTIDGTRYILIEFHPDSSYKEIWNGINQCIFGGYIPIVAHVERYQCLIKNPGLVGELIHLGAYIQMNVSSIKGKISDSRMHFCNKILKKGWVHFLGTDAHGAYDRVPQVKSYLKALKKKLGEERIQQLFWENPMTMLENKHL